MSTSILNIAVTAAIVLNAMNLAMGLRTRRMLRREPR